MNEATTTAAATGRDPDTEIETTELFTPADPWVTEFEKQLTPRLIDGLRNYARPRAFAVAAAGRKVDDYYARELVQDAIGDTWTGLLRWDPKRCSLEFHLVRAIQSRADKHRKHAQSNPHDAIGDETGNSRIAEQDASVLIADPEHAVQRVYSRETMTRIRAEAVRDKPVLRVLDAYDVGAETKDDVLAFTKMRERTYHNAHIRLKRIVRNLTDRQLAPRARA
jgi:hypothetical protein